MSKPIPPLIEITPERVLRFNFHAGQVRAWESEKRTIAVCAGTGSGKTASCPIWLWREIQRRGAGDFAFVSPSHTLMKKRALPEFRNLFETILGLGEYRPGDSEFRFSDAGCVRMFDHKPLTPTRVLFCHAENPNALESMTLKGAVADEAGQKEFKTDSYFALRRRLAFFEGRLFIATTPYSDKGWLREQIYEKWKAGDKTIDFIRFSSLMNPAYPRSEYQWACDNLPLWKKRLFYDAEFERPAGLIYDAFDEKLHKVPRFEIPASWHRFLGLDFGGVNTAGVFFAEEPGTKRWYAYRTYKAGGRTAKEHTAELLKGELGRPICYGGSKSEGQWRDEFRAAGLGVREPDQTEVEVGIGRVYGAMKRGEIFVFDDLPLLLEEITTYARKTNDKGDPTEEIVAKASWHIADAMRYVVSPMKKESPPLRIGMPPAGQANVLESAPDGVFG